VRLEGASARKRRLSLTPIIDVVFLLLLFFMLASTFSRYSSVEVAVGGRSAPMATDQSVPVILLAVRGEGAFSINGAAVTRSDIQRVLRDAAPEEKARIVVRPAKAARAEDIVHAVERAQAAKLGPVILAR
jgi:biopolymer transport protein ExbD